MGEKKLPVNQLGERYCVTDAVFTFVAVGKDGKARGIPREGNLEFRTCVSRHRRITIKLLKGNMMYYVIFAQDIPWYFRKNALLYVSNTLLV